MITLMHLLSISPGPHHSRFSQSQGKLRSTLNLADTLPVEPLYVLGYVAPLAASTTELPKVPITPGEHQSLQNEKQTLLKLKCRGLNKTC